jgi:peptide-methionine (S)-S-oxide reductase
MEKALLGAGCFWGVEKKFSEVKGVLKTEVGYAQGTTKEPSYEEVCRGDTNHCEVVYLEFDPSIINYSQILQFFFQIHDPTTLNRQGGDVGTQYRSLIAYYSDAQKKIAQDVVNDLNVSKFNNNITTSIEAFDYYYPAEEYHQRYIEKKYSFLGEI